VLFTADQAAGSLGMTVGEVADVLLREFGVENALNLDGGGSTALAMHDPATGVARLVNVPSDGAAGRAVGSSLVVFARPAGQD
jgi:exopolysaccharide biosynthesis protein